MSDKQVKVSGRYGVWKIFVRICVVLLLALTIGALLNHMAVSLDNNAGPAGFKRGVLQGALMPMSLPNLLVGKDVTIYSQNNTGVSYKLGYTTGVNACGAIFFGFFFWRVNSWRRRGAER